MNSELAELRREVAKLRADLEGLRRSIPRRSHGLRKQCAPGNSMEAGAWVTQGQLAEFVTTGDTRLSDTRPPVLHRATHYANGSDPLTPANIGAYSIGEINAFNTAVYATIASGLAGKSNTGHTHAAGDIISGVLAVARLGSGTPTASTILFGDGSWKALPTAKIVMGKAVPTLTLSLNGTQNVPVTFGTPMPDTNYDATGEVVSALTVLGVSVLGQLTVTGVTSKTTAGCTLIVKATGASISGIATTLIAVAVRFA